MKRTWLVRTLWLLPLLAGLGAGPATPKAPIPDAKAPPASEEKLLHCSFCGKSQKEVKKLIAGPSVYICNECVALCNDILAEEEALDKAKEKELNQSKLKRKK